MSSNKPAGESVSVAIQQAIARHFVLLDGAPAHDMYNLLMQQVEPALLSVVMEYAHNNQSKAAQWLGLSRNTLRKLLAKYKFE